MDVDGHWLVSAGLVTSSILAVTANSFLLLIFARRRGLRTVPNRFVINLLVTNLLSSLLLIPLLIVDQSNARTNASSAANSSAAVADDDDVALLCYAAQGSTSFVCTLSILSILLIGINQYFGVIHSLRYHFYINKCRSMAFICTTWLVALLFSLLSCLTHSDSSLWQFCETNRRRPSDPVRILNTIYAVSYFALVILAPFAAICVIYVCIYAAAHKNSERMRQSTSANLEQPSPPPPPSDCKLPKVHSAPSFAHYETDSSDDAAQPHRQKVARTNSNNFISNLRHKISNASVFRYREETRAAKISILVIFLVLFCYVPYGIALVLNSQLIRIETSPVFNYVSTVLLVFSNTISPFLFAYRNKRVKREIGKMFGLIPQRSVLPHHHHHHHNGMDRSRRNRSCEDVRNGGDIPTIKEPFLENFVVPEVIVTCQVEKKSILKKMGTTWTSYKKCNFITVPDSCISAEARGSFSSASTQISSEDC